MKKFSLLFFFMLYGCSCKNTYTMGPDIFNLPEDVTIALSKIPDPKHYPTKTTKCKREKRGTPRNPRKHSLIRLTHEERTFQDELRKLSFEELKKRHEADPTRFPQHFFCLETDCTKDHIFALCSLDALRIHVKRHSTGNRSMKFYKEVS